MKVRGYEEKDRKRVEEICIETDRNHLDYEELLTLYCRYYITEEKENCFVATDDEDGVCGYIISASDYYRWREAFYQKYLKDADSRIREKGVGSTEGYEKYARLYPAHLHIDISPSFQRMGLGHLLMDTLLSHYREMGCSGVMLGVNPENEKGVNFYRKYGFEPLDDEGVFWGIRL